MTKPAPRATWVDAVVRGLDAEIWRGLAVRIGICLAIAVLLILLGPFVSLHFHPQLTLLLGAVVGTIIWAFSTFLGPESGPYWEVPIRLERSALMQADIRTRRLAQALAQAQPGQGFEAGTVARQLAELTSRRLAFTASLHRSRCDAQAKGSLVYG